jgi:kynurenine formamidase
VARGFGPARETVSVHPPATSTYGPHVPGAGDYSDYAEIDLLGRRVAVLELSREISPEIPVYPGHVGVAFWDHLTHEQVRRQRLPPESTFRGYAVRGVVMSEHVSTHVDSVWHFQEERPDLTIDRVPWEHLITPAAWIDVSDVGAGAHISLARVLKALDDAEVTLSPGMTLLYRTGVDELWGDRFRFTSEYPGLDAEASRWLLDQGIVNLGTDAVSTDTPADPDYPNHAAHAERLVIHTEVIANIARIPRHRDFWVGFFPLRLVGGTGSPARAVALWEL